MATTKKNAAPAAAPKNPQMEAQVQAIDELSQSVEIAKEIFGKDVTVTPDMVFGIYDRVFCWSFGEDEDDDEEGDK